MAELTMPPLLAHRPGPSPPGRWRILLLPAFLAIVGILLATAAAIAGQDSRRAREYMEIDKNLLHLENELAKAKLEHAGDSTIADITAKISQFQRRQLSGYARPGRHFTEWDAYRYEEIVREGYLYQQPNASDDVKRATVMQVPGDPEPRLKNVAWYPLYPVLAWSVSKLLGISANAALTVVSETCLVLASIILFLYARRHYYNRMPKLDLGAPATSPAGAHPARRWDLLPEDSAALWAVAALIYGPCSIFLYANFTESLFALLLVTFLYCLQGRWWWRAAVIAAAASACRSQGVLFGPVLALVFLFRSDVKKPAARVALAAALGLVSAIGLGFYMLYLRAAFGDPLAFVHVQQGWSVGVNSATIFHALNPVNAMTNLVHCAFYVSPMDWPRLWEAFCVIWPPIVLLIFGGRFLSFELELVGWLLWGLPYVASCLAGNPPGSSPWMSMGRFMAVLIPAYIIAGAVLVRFRWLGVPYLAASATTFGIFAYKFGEGVWVG